MYSEVYLVHSSGGTRTWGWPLLGSCEVPPGYKTTWQIGLWWECIRSEHRVFTGHPGQVRVNWSPMRTTLVPSEDGSTPHGPATFHQAPPLKAPQHYHTRDQASSTTNLWEDTHRPSQEPIGCIGKSFCDHKNVDLISICGGYITYLVVPGWIGGRGGQERIVS